MKSTEGAPRAVLGFRSFGAVFCALASFACPLCASAGEEDAGRGVVLTFFNAPAGAEPLLRPPTLGLAVGSGEVHRAVLDTGSTGVVVSATSILDIDDLPVLGPGRLTYTSSGRIMQGRYVLSAVTVIGKNGATITTRPIPVLAVDSVDCLASARNCEPRERPRGIAMLGVGFAREGDRQRTGTPDKNAFLNLPEMGRPGKPRALRRGYILTRQQVQVGVSPKDAADGFSTIRLESDPTRDDWAPPQACISVARRDRACGTLLVDTGVTSMYLSVPAAQTEGLEHMNARGEPILADGAEVAVALSEGARGPAYSFTVGDMADPVAPERVILVGNGRRPPFINTTVRLLNGYDYLYDADAGLVGFRPARR